MKMFRALMDFHFFHLLSLCCLSWLVGVCSNRTTEIMNVKCIFNCADVVNPDEIFVLQFEREMPEYLWTLYSSQFGKIPFSDWGQNSPTGNKRKAVVIQPLALKEPVPYYFEVSGQGKYSSISGVYSFTTNSPPVGGSCTIQPEKGQALVTKFSVNCARYHDPHLPLKYRIYLKTVISDILLYHGYKDTVKTLTLPMGSKENNHWLILEIGISDSLETSTFASLSVQVYGDEDNLDLLDSAIKNFQFEKSYSHEKTQDFIQHAVNIIEMLGNDRNWDNSNMMLNKKNKKSQLHEFLMHSLQFLMISDKDTLSQVTSLVNSILIQQEKVSPTLATHSLKLTKSLTNFLMEISERAPTETRKIAKKQVEILEYIRDSSLFTGERIIMQIKSRMKTLLSRFDSICNALAKSLHSVVEEPLKIKTKKTIIFVKWLKVSEKDVLLEEELENDHRTSFIMQINASIHQYSQTVKSVNIQMQVWNKSPFVWSLLNNHKFPVIIIDIKERDQVHSFGLKKLPVPADIFFSVEDTAHLPDEYSLNVRWDLVEKKVISSSLLIITVQQIKEKLQYLIIYPKYTSLKLQILLGSSEVAVTFENIMHYGYEWPIQDDLLLSNKDYKQDYRLLFLPEHFLEVNSANFTVGIIMKPGQEVHNENIGELQMVTIAVHSYVADCFYWNEDNDKWQTDGCMVGPFTTQNHLHCQCDYLSAFTGHVDIVPNTHHSLLEGKLLPGLDNPIIVIVVVATWCLYFLLLFWTHRADCNVIRKVGVTILGSDSKKQKYMYLVCVVTGWWPRAGTTSNVYMFLVGKDRLSEHFNLCDSERHLFTAGSEDWFLIKTNVCLGKLTSVVIWHDSSGSNPSWYLKQLVIEDIQTNETWHCLHDQWLSSEKGYDHVYADIPVLEYDMFAANCFYHFVQKASQGLRNGHLFISIFFKQPTSKFTHKQRLTCALSLLLTTMLFNTVLHGMPKTSARFDKKDFHFSLSAIYFGMEVAVLVLPVSSLLVFLFTAIQEKNRAFARGIPDLTITVLSSGSSDSASPTEEVKKKKKDVEEKRKKYVEENRKKDVLVCRLPWYFIYFSYFLTLGISIACSFFVVMFGLRYSFSKSFKWLISFVTSFVLTVFVTQPLKVIVLAIVASLLFRQAVEYDMEEPRKIRDDAAYVRKTILHKQGMLIPDDNDDFTSM